MDIHDLSLRKYFSDLIIYIVMYCDVIIQLYTILYLLDSTCLPDSKEF